MSLFWDSEVGINHRHLFDPMLDSLPYVEGLPLKCTQQRTHSKWQLHAIMNLQSTLSLVIILVTETC